MAGALLGSGIWTRAIYTGTWQPASGGAGSAVEPATGNSLGEFGLASVGDVEASVALAAAAQRAWAKTPAHERAAVLVRAARVFEEHAAELTEWLIREGGSTRIKAALEVRVAAEECEAAAVLATAPYGELLTSALPRLSLEQRIPVGVVAVISPFNVPLVLSMRSVAPALALGNAVLLKPDPRTAVSGGVSIARVFEEAGLPAGLLHLLPGGPEIGSAMIEAQPVRVVSFTGSTAAGRAIAALAANTLTRTHLELGGNSALIVLDDADIERAAACGAFGNFSHAGQVCMGVGRHLVHESLYDRYVEALAGIASSLVVGDPFRTPNVQVGPIIDQRQLDHARLLVEGSVASGARLVTGGTHDGLFFAPTVLADVDHTTPAYVEEVFGPVASVRSFKDDEEAIAFASASEYGLSLGILSPDIPRALGIASKIPTGMIHINDQTINDEPGAPFGGVGASGYSRVGGARANLESFTETQWVTVRAEPLRRSL
jgi:benzaldehyde dehydrogenase (NAD)